ncbi:hypothetical protein B0H10DRAFT_2224216 [Mycena sp. CBHHK59/15]|nr:hypothetical protein B0H10DRAFT_2200467 [Mycena sp. CBHHK59/15]KAJ6611236.1 hypothetical protein B0H10DRAFT_2224216 [Mycena sp. CBHHK59/15]
MRTSSTASTLLLLAALAHAVPQLQRRADIQCPATDKDGTALTGSAPSGDFVTCTYVDAGPCTYFPADGSFSSGSSTCPKGIAQDPSATTDVPSSAGAAPTDPASSTPIDTPSSTPATSTPADTPSSTPATSSPAASTASQQSQTLTQSEPTSSASAGAPAASASASGRPNSALSARTGGARMLCAMIGLAAAWALL